SDSANFIQKPGRTGNREFRMDWKLNIAFILNSRFSVLRYPVCFFLTDHPMTNSDLKGRVEVVLKDEVAPALALEGSALEVLAVTDGIVQLRIGGACAGCPSTIMSLIMTLEQELRSRMPEIEYLEAVP